MESAIKDYHKIFLFVYKQFNVFLIHYILSWSPACYGMLMGDLHQRWQIHMDRIIVCIKPLPMNASHYSVMFALYSAVGGCMYWGQSCIHARMLGCLVNPASLHNALFTGESGSTNAPHMISNWVESGCSAKLNDMALKLSIICQLCWPYQTWEFSGNIQEIRLQNLMIINQHFNAICSIPGYCQLNVLFW